MLKVVNIFSDYFIEVYFPGKYLVFIKDNSF